MRQQRSRWWEACVVVCIAILMASAAVAADGLSPSVTERLRTRVSLDFREADLRSVLTALSQSYGLNLAAGADVKGQVTLSFQEVPLQEVLRVILDLNGYTYDAHNDVIVITPVAGKLTNEVLPLKYARTNELTLLVKQLLSPQGTVQADETGNRFILRDRPAQLALVREFVREVDTPLDQVMIEARLVDITTSDLANLGIKVKGVATQKGFFQKDATEETVTTTLDLHGPSSTLTNDELTIAVAGKNIDLDPTIDMLLRTNRANLLASPSIATISGQPARIVIGEKVPFKEITQTITGTIETVKFLDVGTTLIVTPWVHHDGNITLSIHPEVSSLTEFVNNLPRVATREADTTVTVKNDETIVIAGLIKTEDKETISKIPLLGDLPVVGLFFRNKSMDQAQTELAIFITPHIIEASDVLQKVATDVPQSLMIQQRTSDIAITELWNRANHLIDGVGVFGKQKERAVQFSEAADALEEIAQRFPKHEKAPEALLRLGALYYYDLEEPARAAERLTWLIERYPDGSYVLPARRLLAHARGAQAHRSRIREREQQRQHREAMTAQYRAALAAYRAGEYLQARQGFQTVLELEPENRQAKRLLERTEEALLASEAAPVPLPTELAPPPAAFDIPPVEPEVPPANAE